MELITMQESEQLAECEKIIERGIKTFVEVGTALLLIRDNKLYRKDFATFEDYCKTRWNMSRPRVYQLIDSVNVINNLSTNVDILPATESQARPLASLDPEQQKEVWKIAVTTAPNGKPTAAHVQQVAADYKKPHVTNNSGNNEWYTPADYIESARRVMGSIDLDPASTEYANKTVKATTYFDSASNGLKQKWHGNIWMNPPYKQRLIYEFINKLETENFEQAVILVNNATDTKWGQKLLRLSNVVCFPNGRIRFIAKNGKAKLTPLQGQMFIYIGPNCNDFTNEFIKYGICKMRITTGAK